MLFRTEIDVGFNTCNYISTLVEIRHMLSAVEDTAYFQGVDSEIQEGVGISKSV
jgi:hypothetical protein